MKKVKRTAVLLCLFAVLLVSGMPVQAASRKSKALAAYKKFLSQKTIYWETEPDSMSDYDTNRNRPASKCKFALAYLDKDNVPELLVYGDLTSIYRRTFPVQIYRYKNNKVTYVASACDGSPSATYGNGLYNGFKYYYKKGLFLDCNEAHGGSAVWYYRYVGGKKQTYLLKSMGWVVTRTGSRYQTSYYRCDADGNYHVSDKLTRKAFNKLLKKYTGSAKLKKAKFYKNTAANRKKWLK